MKRFRLPPGALPATRLFDGLLLACAVLPHLLHLPGWTSLVAAAALAWALAARRYAIPRVRLLTGLLAGLALAGAWFGFGGRVSGDGTLAFLAWALLLKHAEAAGERDRLFNAFAALLLAAWLPLYYDSLAGMVLAATASLLFFLTLQAGQTPAWPARTVLAATGRLWLLALPFAALLFGFFPRIPGPLWDIGLALGLPVRVEVETSRGGIGLDDSLGQRADKLGGRSNPTILVAEFQDFVPTTASLYWRGPVFWRFDGSVWKTEHEGFSRGLLLKEAYKTGERLAATLNRKEKPVRYKVRLMPHGKHWLYGLDLPAENPAESFVSRDYQVLSIRDVDRETAFEGRAWLDYGGGDPPTATQRDLGLQLPDGSDARLIALGRQIGADAPSPQAAAQGVLAEFAKGGFHVAPANPILPGPDALDRIYFETRAAQPMQMASAFAIAMRAAGIPTRLVAGYRGGRVMALTNYVVVKQANAHVWAESWLPGSGWTRYDPVDVVSPATGQAVAPASSPAPQAAPASRAASPVAPVQAAPADLEAAEALAGFKAALDKWVLHFDAARQTDILAALGLGRATWWSVLLVAAAAALALTGLYGGILAWRSHRRRDPVVAGWLRIESRLRDIGIRREAAECPSRFARRVARLRPDLAERLAPLAEEYLGLRYGRRGGGRDQSFLAKAGRFKV